MLVSLGKRTSEESLSGLLLACHQRIRAFSQLALTAAVRHDVPPDETRDACARCARYFREALPLHVADEEESLLPRLRGQRTALDEALATMHAQHAEHAAPLAELLAALARVGDAPGDLTLREPLRDVAARVEREFAAHLALEESVVFPALAELLSAAQQAEVVAELRARRA